jgi:hypothetical protein
MMTVIIIILATEFLLSSSQASATGPCLSCIHYGSMHFCTLKCKYVVTKTKLNSVVLVRKRTIPTERPTLSAK